MFPSNATWNQNATTFAYKILIGAEPYGLFIDTNNSIYTINRQKGQIIIWMNNSNDTNLILYTQLSSISLSIFVTTNGQIYVGDSNSIKSNSYSNQTISIANVSDACRGLFVDLNNTLYCSMLFEHKVVKKWLNDSSSTMTIAAGNGSNGSASNLLKGPYGIFVDTNFDLYVADCWNNRIQLFHLGQTNGITVAGSGSLNLTISLRTPTNVILDGNKYIFIADSDNHRIIGSDENGFRCIIACSGSSGSTSYQLYNPRSIAFDSFGNLFVADRDNNRTQKFYLLSNLSNSKRKNNDSIFSFHYLGGTTTTTISTTASLSLVVPTCSNKTMGPNCNISSNPCDLLKPCKNNGTCENRDESYFCNCSKYFSGSECEIDNRRCKPTTCWNNGKCNETTGECLCEEGWTGEFCEKMINYCENVTCDNNAPCRPSFLNFTCECLGENYSGRYCEIVSTKLATLQFVSKSFGYIAILFLSIVIGFIVIMDVLKYGFGIDPTKDELERIRREKARKRKHRPVIQRFHYVN